MLTRISKPHLVDFLRIADSRKWLNPRIRYASVRSKPELIYDLKSHFRILMVNNHLVFCPRRARGLPQVQYDLCRKEYLLDGVRVDIPKLSREKPQFQISHPSDSNVLDSLGLKNLAFHRASFWERVSVSSTRPRVSGAVSVQTTRSGR